ncbi:cholecystokinin [Thalassophryne amazonica]|uniref:cholecystokinin n=1 Tax=Thalassophryne amazonica TaxID=390379 RepID=UPI001472040D|nr:cholecystokinin [Thalassophryne amazonica]
MSPEGMMLCALVAALLLCGSAAPPGTGSADGDFLQQLVVRRETASSGSDPADRLDPAGQKVPARAARRVHLSEDAREMMTKQFMQTLADVLNSECMSDRDYTGWVDFGRRDAE